MNSEMLFIAGIGIGFLLGVAFLSAVVIRPLAQKVRFYQSQLDQMWTNPPTGKK